MRTFNKQEKRILRKITGLSVKGTKTISPIVILENILNLHSQLYVIKGEDISSMPEEGAFPYSGIEISGKADDVYKDFFGLTQRLADINDFIDYLLRKEYLEIREPKSISGFYLNKIENIAEALEDEDSGIVKVDLKITPSIAVFLEKFSYYYTPTEALIHLIKNNFSDGTEQINPWLKKSSVTFLIDYILRRPLNWNNIIYQQTNRRSIKARPFKVFIILMTV